LRRVISVLSMAFAPMQPHVGPYHGRPPAPNQLPLGRFEPPGLAMPAALLDHPTPAIQATVNPANRAIVRRLERYVNDPRYNFYAQRFQNKVGSVGRSALGSLTSIGVFRSVLCLSGVSSTRCMKLCGS